MEGGSDSKEEVVGREYGVTWRWVTWRWSSVSTWAEEACGCTVAATSTVEEGGWVVEEVQG